jgi:hypothetical protein
MQSCAQGRVDKPVVTRRRLYLWGCSVKERNLRFSFREGSAVFGSDYGTLPCASVDARAHAHASGSSQQRLVRIEYDLPCAGRRR